MTRKPDPINVFIVEQHNSVLNILYRGIGSKKIPYSQLKLLHYDAHPDMGVSTSSRKTVLQNPMNLLNESSIENWILPAVYAGHVDHVIWMRPAFCNQLGDRMSKEYHVGYCCKGTQMMVDINDLYYINEGVYAPTAALENKVKFKLSVGPIHYTHTMCKFCYDINIQLMNTNFILDIDLDTFAPVNPFKDRFTATQDALITDLYGCARDDVAVKALHELSNQPFSFRLKHVRYPAKRCDGQLPDVPRGSIPEAIATSLSTERRTQLNRLHAFIRDFHCGIFPSQFESLKLFSLLVSVVGFDKMLLLLNENEEAALRRLQDDRLLVADEERQLLSRRASLPLLPSSVMSQIEAIFSNERSSRSYFFVLHELESVHDQLCTISADGFCAGWNRFVRRQQFTTTATDDGSSSIDTSQEDSMLYWHYVWSSCGTQWNDPLDSLPHRPNSTASELQDALEDLASLLNRLHSPAMVTIARSADDGYIGRAQADAVETAVLQCLRRVYENRGINVVRYSPDELFLWPSSRRNRSASKYANEVVATPVSFRTPASTDNLENKDII